MLLKLRIYFLLGNCTLSTLWVLDFSINQLFLKLIFDSDWVFIFSSFLGSKHLEILPCELMQQWEDTLDMMYASLC